MIPVARDEVAPLVLRDREQAVRWLSSGLCAMRVLLPSTEEVRRVGPWLIAAVGERLDLPPAGVIADIGAMLLGGTLANLANSASATSSASTATGRERTRRTSGDARLDDAIRRYEDTLLGRLSSDPRLLAAGDAVTRLPQPLHAQAVGILVASVLSRIGFDRGVTIQPGVLRNATERSAGEVLDRGYATLRDDTATRAMLAEGYESLVRGALRARQILGESDLFTLENLHVLRSLTQRLAMAQVVEAHEALAASLPRRIPRSRRSSGSTPTRLEDESEYPIGGFSSMSTSGSLENLVTSELIYMERGADVDLFDMRYVEGELLYYTRDEAIAVRQRREITFLLDEGLIAARVKDATLPWQRIIVLLGLVLTCVKRLSESLGEETLFFRVVFLRDPTRTSSALAEERALADLVLREWRDKGAAEIRESTWAEEAVRTKEAVRRALVEVVLCGATNLGEVWKGFGVDPRVVSVGLVASWSEMESWEKAAVEALAALL